MSKFMSSVGLMLASLAGPGSMVRAGEPLSAAHKAGLSVEVVTLKYGPYLFADALVMQDRLALKGYATEIVLGNDDFYHVRALKVTAVRRVIRGGGPTASAHPFPTIHMEAPVGEPPVSCRRCDDGKPDLKRLPLPPGKTAARQSTPNDHEDESPAAGRASGPTLEDVS